MYKSKNTTIKENNIPTGWREVKVGEVCKVITGKTPPTVNKDYYNGDILFISPADLGSEKYITKSGKTLTSLGGSKSPTIPENSILFVCIGSTIGKIAINKCEARTNQQINSVIPNTQYVNNEFIYYSLSKISKNIKLLAATQAVPIVSKSQFEISKILLPPLPEQKEIARIIEKWDEAIETTTKLIEAKKKRFEWLLNNFFSSSKERLKISDLLDDITIEKGKPLKKDQTAEGLIPVIAGGKISPYFHDTFTHNFPCITISASGAYAGYVAYHTKPIWASDCNVVYCKKASTEYLFYALKQQQNKVYSLQSGGGQPHIYSSDLKTLEIYWPELSQQNQIAKTLSTAKQEITILEEILTKYKSQKKGLMQKLLTGKIRVKL